MKSWVSSEQKNVGAENEGMPKSAPDPPALLRQLILIKLIFLHSQRRAKPSRDGWSVVLALWASFFFFFFLICSFTWVSLEKLLPSSGSLTHLGTTAEGEHSFSKSKQVLGYLKTLLFDSFSLTEQSPSR